MLEIEAVIVKDKSGSFSKNGETIRYRKVAVLIDGEYYEIGVNNALKGEIPTGQCTIQVSLVPDEKKRPRMRIESFV